MRQSNCERVMGLGGCLVMDKKCMMAIRWNEESGLISRTQSVAGVELAW